MFVVKNRREIVWTAVFVVTGVAVGAFLKLSPILKTFHFSESKSEVRIVVDAGHGMPDGGAVGANGTIEQKINLDVAKKLREVLEGKNIRTIMTREDEECLADAGEGKTIRQMKREDMNTRLEIMKESNADLFVSIHMNHFPQTDVSGLRLFYDKKHSEIKGLAEDMQEKMSEVTGAKMYTVKTADQGLFLMKNPPMPVLLVECGFVSNPEEEKKLNDFDYQSRIAWAIADTIEKYYKE